MGFKYSAIGTRPDDISRSTGESTLRPIGVIDDRLRIFGLTKPIF